MDQRFLKMMFTNAERKLECKHYLLTLYDISSCYTQLDMLWKRKGEKGRTEKKESKQVGEQEYQIIQKKKKKKEKMKMKNLYKMPPKPNKIYVLQLFWKIPKHRCKILKEEYK